MSLLDIEPQEIYTVSRLNNEARYLLEDAFPMIWIEGEISNFAAPHSGHWYFSLKDHSAQVRCAMFRGSQRQLNFVPKDGAHVLIRARVSLYENRGEFQLIAEHLEERGEGKLRLAFEALKKKLEVAGLFDQKHKKTFPVFPQHIGIITSPTGAAIRDILTVLKRRFACAPIMIYPSLVQGEMAAPAIVQALQIANQRRECDVLVLTRGGGSLEDLWPFNEESVAYAIHQSNIPIITGIGHEVDFTIADFVADKRAPTPSAAAEMLTPDKNELLKIIKRHQLYFYRYIQQKLAASKQHLSWVYKHLYQQHPKRQLREKMQRLDFYELALVQYQRRLLDQLRAKLSNASATLDALSPLATLSRGYAIATKQHQILTNINAVTEGDQITLQLAVGQMDCTVERKF